MSAGKTFTESQALCTRVLTAHVSTAVRTGQQSKRPTPGTRERRLAQRFMNCCAGIKTMVSNYIVIKETVFHILANKKNKEIWTMFTMLQLHVYEGR